MTRIPAGESPDDYVWTAHLRQRMRSRGIQQEEVLKALGRASPTVSHTTGSLCYRQVLDDGRTLKVWVRASTHKPRIIVSAAWEGDS